MDSNSYIFQIENLDERQRELAYGLYYKCFKVIYWASFIFSMLIVLISAMIESYLVAVIGLALEATVMGVQLYFAVKCVKLGILNPFYAEKMSKTSSIICYTLSALILTFNCFFQWQESKDNYFIIVFVFIALTYSCLIAGGFIAKKSIEKSEQDDEED